MFSSLPECYREERDIKERELKEHRAKKLKLKIKNGVSYADEVNMLQTRNFLFKSLASMMEGFVLEEGRMEIEQTQEKQRTTFEENEEQINNFESKSVNTKKEGKETILRSIRKLEMNHLLNLAYSSREKNNNRLQALLQKADTRKIFLSEEEAFFKFNQSKPENVKPGNFDNLIPPTDLLYNLKSFFPVEKKYLQLMEARAVSRNKSNVTLFASLKMKKNGDKTMKPEEIVCQVCNSGDYQEKNLIVFCSLCNVSTHQLCYGMQKVPKEDWLCDLCVQFGPKGKYLRCWLCNCRGGVLKNSEVTANTPYLMRNGVYSEAVSIGDHEPPFIQDKSKVVYPVKQLYDFYKESYKFSEDELKNEPLPENMWVHSSCALWNGYINVKDQRLKGFSDIPLFTFLKICAVCNSSIGCCIKCSRDDCNVYFHVECGRRVRLFMEMIGVNTPKFLMYCASHTPLMLKIMIEEYERKSREEVIKFYRYIKRFLKSNKIILDNVDSKVRMTGGKDKGERLELSDLARFIDYDKQSFLMEIKHELYRKPDYQTTISIKRMNGEYVVDNIEPASKRLFKNRMPQSSNIWKKLAARHNRTAKTMFGRFQSITKELKLMGQNQGNYINKKTVSGLGREEEHFEPNNENFDDQIYCICKKEWKGELMIECDRCTGWFHPKCINSSIMNEIEINNNHVLCFKCKKEYEKDYCENIEIVSNEGGETNFLLRKCSSRENNFARKKKKEKKEEKRELAVIKEDTEEKNGCMNGSGFIEEKVEENKEEIVLSRKEEGVVDREEGEVVVNDSDEEGIVNRVEILNISELKINIENRMVEEKVTEDVKNDLKESEDKEEREQEEEREHEESKNKEETKDTKEIKEVKETKEAPLELQKKISYNNLSEIN